MGKSVYIAEKPSVAQSFAKALHHAYEREDGYLESEDSIITWCVGHLVTMSYPDAYDPALKRWSLDSLPFIPRTFRYEVIPSARKQFTIVSKLLNRPDVDTIYVCTDSGREGEYIYRLVEQEAHVTGKKRLRVWIDSQTEAEILRGIEEAKDECAYDHLASAAYCRAKEDYLMGINFSRLLTLKYGNTISAYLHTKRCVISVGRVMTCVLGMVVRREREIRSFTPMPFYRVMAHFGETSPSFEGEWTVQEGSRFFGSPYLYKDTGLSDRDQAEKLIRDLSADQPVTGEVTHVENKTEKKNPPLLFNLAELQNACAKRFRISPDQTLSIAQELYEKKLVTYPRTDARVLSTAVAEEIHQNLNGLMKYEPAVPFLKEIVTFGSYKDLSKTRYVNDQKITDHYAIIPTGEGLGALDKCSELARKVYDLIVRRFLGIFYPPAKYSRLSIDIGIQGESFHAGLKVLSEKGYLNVADPSGDAGENPTDDPALFEQLKGLKKGTKLSVSSMDCREGKTTPPKRYNSGSLILAMENAGQFIEDEELRAQIKGSGIGTSATRGDILKKLVANQYLALNKKSQIMTPTLLGEMIYDVVDHSIRPLLNAELTASWERGLTYVEEGDITEDAYMVKLTDFIRSRTEAVRDQSDTHELRACFDRAAAFYPAMKDRKGTKKTQTKK